MHVPESAGIHMIVRRCVCGGVETDRQIDRQTEQRATAAPIPQTLSVLYFLESGSFIGPDHEVS